MTESKLDILEKQLNALFKEEIPKQAVHDIHAAMAVAKMLEAEGFTFQLKDLYPKSMTETGWRAIFSKGGVAFSAEDHQSSVAVCMAAVGALSPEPD